MGGNYFDHIAREILQQQQLMDTLQEENRELRRQLADLSAGRGIFVDVNGQRFALLDSTVDTIPANDHVQPASEAIPGKIFDSQEVSLQEVSSEEDGTEKTLVPIIQATIEDSQPLPVQAAPVQRAQTFLEEVMIDEFAAALTSPIPAPLKPSGEQDDINEEQKALLRQELLGSYLLE